MSKQDKKWIHQVIIGESKKTTILVCKNCDLAYKDLDFSNRLENNNGCFKCGKNDFEKKILLSDD